jgi:hypothetical protein
MDEAQLHLAFEPFNRLGRELEGIEGTGIGLPNVRTLVERMGGRLDASSTPGAGSRFEVCLPAAGPAPAPAAAAASLPPTDFASSVFGSPAVTGPARLLYIEDNPVNAMIVSELLARRSDLHLHIAVDGSSGLEHARAHRPDLILLDMQLPDIDGMQVLAALKADPATASIPCVALSANAMPADIERAYQAGVSDYWTKPLDYRAFMASIDAIFGPAT